MEPYREIKAISTSETLLVRQSVLRPGKPLQVCEFEGDEALETFHLGFFLNNQLAGIGSFMKMSNPPFKNEIQWRIRGMAVLSQFQGKGIGKELLKAGEKKIKNSNPSALLWFNARETAIEFYKKYGYKTIGEKFDIAGVCTHIVMWKKVS